MEVEINSKFPKFEILCRILSEELLAKQQIDFDEFKTSSPEHRYLNWMQKRPDFISACTTASIIKLFRHQTTIVEQDANQTHWKKEAGGEEYFRIVGNILHHYAIFLETQLIASLSLTAEQRYKDLLLQQPEKIKQIPLSHIASYLGITLERLSRIRKKTKRLI